jgi:hypothetical protein
LVAWPDWSQTVSADTSAGDAIANTTHAATILMSNILLRRKSRIRPAHPPFVGR